VRQSDPETAAALEKLEKAHVALFDSDAASGLDLRVNRSRNSSNSRQRAVAWLSLVDADAKFSTFFQFPLDASGHESATEANSRLMDILVHGKRKGSSTSSDQMSSDSAATSARCGSSGCYMHSKCDEWA
jgi:hypothetical protein